MQKVGFVELKRGKEKSKAKHQDIQSFYSNINKTKEKVAEIIEEKESIIKQLNEELSNTKVLAQKEIEARNNIITKIAECYNIKKEHINKVYKRIRVDLNKDDNTQVTQKKYSQKNLELSKNGEELER